MEFNIQYKIKGNYCVQKYFYMTSYYMYTSYTLAHKLLMYNNIYEE